MKSILRNDDINTKNSFCVLILLSKDEQTQIENTVDYSVTIEGSLFGFTKLGGSRYSHEIAHRKYLS